MTHVLANTPSFIETQFPVAKLSMESYKERMANYSQTLTGLGKWWGRKPLVLVRAAILGLLLPSTNDPEKDMQVFLQLMTMDPEGLRRRKKRTIPGKRCFRELQTMPPSLQERFFSYDDDGKPTVNLRSMPRDEKEELQRLIFERMSYTQKLRYCYRPEEIIGPSEAAWAEINAHLGTQANNLPELVEELGERRFGHRPRVGDAFCGGGSIPFEAARLGCDAYGSDLNPVAALLTWASLNIIGGSKKTARDVTKAQKKVYDSVDKRIIELGIEHNSLGWRADGYLYCVEVIDPETGWKIPLAPSWVIGKGTKTIAKLVPNPDLKRYDIEIHQDVSDEELRLAKEFGTFQNSRLVPPNGEATTPLDSLRKGMRLWDKNDLIPRPDDVFQERLFCIQWAEFEKDKNGKLIKKWHYRAPTKEDFSRETLVLNLLKERFCDWLERGYLPSRKITPGYNTDQPTRERGWTYWHHLFTPRQLLLCGFVLEYIDHESMSSENKASILLSLGRCLNYMSRLAIWHSAKGNENVERVFTNQALNTSTFYASRSWPTLKNNFIYEANGLDIPGKSKIYPQDARETEVKSDFWITDPPYADAVNYDEISEFFLCWYEYTLNKLFPGWYTDSKRALAIKGATQDFRSSMVQSYQKLVELTPDNGQQIVMFTHQDASVWADLTLILWAAGLRVTTAWTIATETNPGYKSGNYVQGTVLLVLRKRTETEPVFIDEIHYKVEEEIRRQLDLMTELDDDSDPNFGDADYQLAAYAAALRVLTAQPIYEINPEREILRARENGEVSPVESLIRNAVKIACDHLLPRELDPELWRFLGPMERFYLKGLEIESHGEYRSGVYQELARGFGATDYTDLLANTKANQTRLKTAKEFGRRMLSGEGFASSLVRHCLHAVYLTTREDETQVGLDWFHTELGHNYWGQRQKIIHLLDYLARLRYNRDMPHWEANAKAAHLLAGAARNDHA